MQGTIRFTYSKTLKALILNFRTALRSVTRMYSAHSGIDFGIGRERKLTLTLTLILILTLTLYSSFTCWRPHSGGRKHVRINVYVLINLYIAKYYIPMFNWSWSIAPHIYSCNARIHTLHTLHTLHASQFFKLKVILFNVNK